MIVSHDIGSCLRFTVWIASVSIKSLFTVWYINNFFDTVMWPKARLDQWWNYQPNRAMGTLKVDFRKFFTFQPKFVVVRFSRSSFHCLQRSLELLAEPFCQTKQDWLTLTKLANLNFQISQWIWYQKLAKILWSINKLELWKLFQ